MLLAQEPEPPPPLRVLTANVRYGTAADGENAWDRRREALLAVLAQQNADVIALQEALAFQLDWLLEKMPRYRASGAFRRGGRRDEWTGLLLDRERFAVEREGQFWLSERPEEVGSVGWDAALPRLCAWAVLAERGGARYALFASHFDHQGAAARAQSMQLLLERRGQLAPELPALLLGDFNAAEDAPPLRAAAAAGFRDSFRVLHPAAAPAGTFHGFRGGDGGAKIDYILMDRRWTVHEAAVVRSAVEGRYPSDHYFVSAVLAPAAAAAPPAPPR